MEPETTFKDIITNRHVLIWGSVCIGIVALIAGLAYFSTPEPVFKDATAPGVTETDWVRGDRATAKAVLVEYSDFECPACAFYAPMLKKLEEDTKGEIVVAYRHFPLTRIHPHAPLAARAAEAAGVQGKFFEMHDELFGNQTTWSKEGDPRNTFIEYAKKLGLNETQFIQDLDSDAVKTKVSLAEQEGKNIGLTGTPSFFINGTQITPTNSYAEFKERVLAEVNKQ